MYFFWEEDHRCKMSLSTHHIKRMSYQHNIPVDVNLGHLTKVVFVRFIRWHLSPLRHLSIFFFFLSTPFFLELRSQGFSSRVIWYIPAPALESVLSPRIPGSWYWRTRLKTKICGGTVRCTFTFKVSQLIYHVLHVIIVLW